MIEEYSEKIIKILERVKGIVRSTFGGSAWSRWESEGEVVAELDQYINTLKNKDYSKINHITLLFAPTSSFQELSIDNGWGDVFCNIAEEFDDAVDNLISELKKSKILKY